MRFNSIIIKMMEKREEKIFNNDNLNSPIKQTLHLIAFVERQN
jgi:hypothetical protein